MAFKGYPNDILSQSTEVLGACKQINSNLQLGDLSQAAFAEELAEVQALQGQLQDLELQMTDIRNRRDEHLAHMWDGIKRVRSTVKGMYGDDSFEYELVGCTRISGRKRPTRKTVA